MAVARRRTAGRRAMRCPGRAARGSIGPRFSPVDEWLRDGGGREVGAPRDQSATNQRAEVLAGGAPARGGPPPGPLADDARRPTPRCRARGRRGERASASATVKGRRSRVVIGGRSETLAAKAHAFDGAANPRAGSAFHTYPLLSFRVQRWGCRAECETCGSPFFCAELTRHAVRPKHWRLPERGICRRSSGAHDVSVNRALLHPLSFAIEQSSDG